VARRWNKLETFLAVAAIGVGALLTFIAGLHTYMTTTATTLHPVPAEVPSKAARAPDAAWAEAVARGRETARTALSGQNLPGLSVAVGVDGAVVWAEGFGFADLDTRETVTPDTRFRIGSASIALTSAAAGLLIEEDAVRLDEAVRTYVPEFPETPHPVTLRHVMGHVAGIRNDGGDEGPLLSAHCDRPAEGVQRIAEYDLLSAPGAAYHYSLYGWIVVSAAIEAAANEPFLTVMRERVFEPLGMDDTAADVPAQRRRDMASSYFPRYSADPRYGLHPMRDVDYSCYAGASAFISTPSDLVRFGLALTSGALLQPSTVAQLQTSLRLPSGADTEYGLGWDIEPVMLGGTPTRWVGHDGELLGGRVATLMTFPDRGLVVAVTSNISYADTTDVALRVAEAFAPPTTPAAPR